jgi:predicted RNA binding protein YcfA (HicA-like mRNA interferase family)
LARREKLVEKMRNSPGNVRFSEVDALLKYEGFVLFNQRGSHCTYHRADGRVLTIVKPHGKRKTCYPTDILKVLTILEL